MFCDSNDSLPLNLHKVYILFDKNNDRAEMLVIMYKRELLGKK